MRRDRVLAALVFGGWALGVTLYADGRSPFGLFKQYCAKCHGEDGKADTPRGKQMKARNFTDAEWQQSMSDADLIDSVTNGKGRHAAVRQEADEGADREPGQGRRAGFRGKK